MGSLGGGADATTDGEHDILACTHLGVGGQQEIIEVDPGVVSTGVAVLDHHDDVMVGVVLGDGQGGADLVHGARLEGDVGEAVLVEALDQLGGLLGLGDTGGDDHTVDGGTGSAGAGHDALRTELQVPDVAVEEHGVELGGAARVQLLDQVLLVAVEHLLRVLSAAGHLSPVAGVGGCGDDGGIHGGGGHATEQDR